LVESLLLFSAETQRVICSVLIVWNWLLS